jgi:hypothetical protein
MKIKGIQVMIAGTSASMTLENLKKIFAGGVDSTFAQHCCDHSSEVRPVTPTEVHEMVKDGSFEKSFNSFGVDLNLIAFTPVQVALWVETHPDMLRQRGYSTFLLYKVGDEFFVADVRVLSDGLLVDAYRFSVDSVWDAERRHRVVVPQLAP